MQVLLSQVQNSEQLLRTLQGTVSQAQERVQLQMVRAWVLGQQGEEYDGNWLVHGRLRHLSCPPAARAAPGLGAKWVEEFLGYLALWPEPGLGQTEPAMHPLCDLEIEITRPNLQDHED